MSMEVRQATPADEPDVVAFTQATWPGRHGDYLPRVFADWVARDGPAERTFVVDDEGAAVGVVKAVLQTPREAWMQGMRIAPDYRGRGLSTRLHEAAADWARERGATVGRGIVFSWNGPALAASRVAGFEPATEYRWAHPAPDPAAEPDLTVDDDVDAGWSYWQRSAARSHLRGLAYDMDETWAVRELTRDTLERAAAETFLGVVKADGTRGLAFRSRDVDREDDAGEPVHLAEYGLAAWADPAACASLVAAIARDAAALGADRTRVFVPETVAAVSDAALAGAELGEEPLFVLEADLTRLD